MRCAVWITARLSGVVQVFIEGVERGAPVMSFD